MGLVSELPTTTKRVLPATVIEGERGCEHAMRFSSLPTFVLEGVHSRASAFLQRFVHRFCIVSAAFHQSFETVHHGWPD
jgi:hypothetical protein